MRGRIEIQIRLVVALRSGSVAVSVTGPLGRLGHESSKRPFSTSTGCPSAISDAPGSIVPATRIGLPLGIIVPGGSSLIGGPVVSTVNRQRFVAVEPGKPPLALAVSTWLPSGSELPSRIRRPFDR